MRQLARMTKSEGEIFHRVRRMHLGDEAAVVRQYIQADRMSTPLGCGRFRKTIEADISKRMQANVESQKGDGR